MNRSGFRQLTVLIVVILLTGAGCIRIETGQTSEEATASSEERAKYIRSTWANRFLDASPPDMLKMMTDHVRTVADSYIEYGYDVADQWREGEAGRGEEISASEMQEVVSGWVKIEQPILLAWEDNLEHGRVRIEESGYYDEDAMGLINKLVDYYYEVYSIVFYPSGKVNEYEQELDWLKIRMERVIEELDTALSRY
ncbi:MAG: hypothetical protein U9R56_05480 [candidate division Zixibacteria bacterium]|nr:hypothetical protein [candidate division Zixibacteria bacterium]